jgi:hypothetical protein
MPSRLCVATRQREHALVPTHYRLHATRSVEDGIPTRSGGTSKGIRLGHGAGLKREKGTWPNRVRHDWATTPFFTPLPY